MADTADKVKIGEISSQLTKASRLVLSTDGFWIQTGGDSQGNGQSVLIPAEFVRAYLTNGIAPSIGDDGNWYINGKNLGVKAEGVTPQFRGGTLGIEVSYDKGVTWKTAVLYSDMDIDIDELEKQYKKTIEGEQQRVEHENTRITNETARQTNEQTRQSNEQKRVDAENARINAEKARVSNVGTVIDNANKATTAANSAAQSANDAKTAATTAATNANDAAKTATDAAKTATDAAGKADQATENAQDATSLAQTAATSANNASANAQTAEVQRAAAEAQRATAYQKMAEGNAATIAEMQRVVSNITNAQSSAPMTSVPASIYTETDRTAGVGETINIAPTLFAPSTCNHSVIYNVYSGNAKVDYKGDVALPAEAGDSVIEVIPTLNNGATRIVTVHAVVPTAILDLDGEEITDEKGEAITA